VENKMPRGMWRWWETTNGADVWWARVEEQPGEWRDVGDAEYGRAGIKPPFWELPLQEEYFESLREDPAAEAESRLKHEFVLPGIIALMLSFCLLFVLYGGGYALLVKRNVLH
jgi:hypothetical protein